ncbi:MAG: hypothetical protein MRY21_01510 [Simkaniaceae bacterium]|nr:hypothetical protein [Simkaniaceae bacterium]
MVKLLPHSIRLALSLAYLWENPYRCARKFNQSRAAKLLHDYGETPLEVVKQIIDYFGVKKGDSLIDLGSGTGRAAFCFHHIAGCVTLGVDHNPKFIERAEWVVSFLKLSGIAFQNRDLLTLRFEGVDWVYLAGTCMNEYLIRELKTHLEKYPVKVLSVGEPLFKEIDSVPASFPWGETRIYLSASSSS